MPLPLQQAPELEAVAPEQLLLCPGHRALIPGVWIPEIKADQRLFPCFKGNSIFTFTSCYRQGSWRNVSKLRPGNHGIAPQPPLPKPTHGMCPPHRSWARRLPLRVLLQRYELSGSETCTWLCCHITGSKSAQPLGQQGNLSNFWNHHNSGKTSSLALAKHFEVNATGIHL